MYGLRKFWLQVIDEVGNPVTSGLTVSVNQANIYSDEYQTAITNPIVTTTNGVVEFWCAAASVEVIVANTAGGISVKRSLTAATADHRIVLPQHQNVLEQPMPRVEFFDDFLGGYTSLDRWTLALDTNGLMTIDDAADGVGLLLCDGDDNDASTLHSTDETFLCQTDKNIFFEARVKLAQANDNDANIFVGLADIVTVDLMQDDGGGPTTTLDGVGFHLLDGGSAWQFETSNATTATASGSLATFVDDTWVRLGFKYDYNDGTTAKVTPYINGVAYAPVNLTISGMAEMNVALSVKGSGAEETLKIDYVRVIADRAD